MMTLRGFVLPLALTLPRTHTTPEAFSILHLSDPARILIFFTTKSCCSLPAASLFLFFFFPFFRCIICFGRFPVDCMAFWGFDFFFPFFPFRFTSVKTGIRMIHDLLAD